MSVEIVAIEEKHIQGFADCLASVAEERRWIGLFSGLGEERARQFVMSMIENDNPQFVAVDGEKVVGWIDITPSNSLVSAHVGGLGMGLLEAYRGQGLGSRLMQAALDKARTIEKIKRIELEVFDHNVPAIKLYEKFGFQYEGRKLKAALLDDGYQDLLIMGLWIGEASG